MRDLMDRVFGSMTGLALGVVLAFAQQRGPQPAPTVPSSPSTPTAPGYPNTLPAPGSQPQYGVPEFQRPIFLSGKVMMDDGTPPPDPVVIQRVCNGRPRPEGYTDSKGRFSFQLGQNLSVLPDASVGRGDYTPNSTNLGINPATGVGVGSSEEMERVLMNCELRADLPGFRSDSVSLAGRRALDNPEVGIIVLHRIGNVEGLTISATSLMAPKDARKAYEKGLEATQETQARRRPEGFPEGRGHLPEVRQRLVPVGLGVPGQECSTTRARPTLPRWRPMPSSSARTCNWRRCPRRNKMAGRCRHHGSRPQIEFDQFSPRVLL